MKIKIINATAITNIGDEIIKNATICIENDKIVGIFCGNADDFSADKIIDFEGDILMPGFINAHAHNAMILLRGLNDELPLQKWLYENNFPIEAKMQPSDIYWASLFAGLQCLECGITTVLDEYFFAPEIIKAYKKIGIRAFVPTTIDLLDNGNRYEFLVSSHNENKSLYNDLIKEIAYCHSIYTQSDKQIEDTIKYAKDYNLISTIHASENLEEVGECANNNRNLSPIGYLEYLGYFDNPALIAHGVCVDKDDIAILKQYDVSVVTNPASNLKLGSGFAPLQSYIQQGINICIGTDGSASNNGIDFFRDIYLTATLQKGMLNDPTVLPAREVIKMATLNGAKALKLDDVGLIKKGYQADLIRINAKSLSMTPIHSVFSNIVYSASKSDVLMTMVAGNIVYENGKFTNVDNIQDIISLCSQIAERLKNEANIK